MMDEQLNMRVVFKLNILPSNVKYVYFNNTTYLTTFEAHYM